MIADPPGRRSATPEPDPRLLQIVPFRAAPLDSPIDEPPARNRAAPPKQGHPNSQASSPWLFSFFGNFVKAAFTTASKSLGDTWVFRAYWKLLRWALIASLAIPIGFLCLGLLYLTVLALWAMGNPREIVKATFSMFAAVPNYLRWVWTEIVDEVKIQIREAIFGPARA